MLYVYELAAQSVIKSAFLFVFQSGSDSRRLEQAMVYPQPVLPPSATGFGCTSNLVPYRRVSDGHVQKKRKVGERLGGSGERLERHVCYICKEVSKVPKPHNSNWVPLCDVW